MKLPRFAWAIALASFATTRALGWIYWFAPPDWPAASGTLLHNAESSPVLFTEEGFIRAMQDNPAEPAGSDVTINLLPGRYPTGPLRFRLLYNAQDAGIIQRLRARRLTVHRAPGYAGAVVFRLKPEVANQAIGETWMLANGAPGPIGRWVVEDITFDCNWQHLASQIHPANLRRYKNGALLLDAYTGAIRRVRVVNYGANNIVPVPTYATAGAEAFAILIHATDFRQAPEPGSGAPTAWVVEDCEISGFNGVHGGYSTALMVTVGYPKVEPSTGETHDGIGTLFDEVPPELRARYGGFYYWFQVQEQPGSGPGQRDWRVATVRRCLTRNVPIGLGLAAGGGVTYSDNVVLRAQAGFNTDTGPIRNVDFTNNVFLDVVWGGKIGGWGWGASGFVNYLVRGNLVRLSGPALQQNYGDFCVTPEGDLASKPAPSLGGFFTNTCAALTVGGTSGIDFSRNRITTRPRARFFQPNPSDINRAVFRAVHRPDRGLELHWCSGPAMPINQEIAPMTDELMLSGVAFEFSDFSTLSPGSGTTDLLPAISLPPPGFPPGVALGDPGRIQLLTDEQGNLTGVNEVAIGAPEPLGDGSFQVRAQWFTHPSARSAPGSTRVNPPDPIRFQVLDPAGQKIAVQGPAFAAERATIRFVPSAAGRYHITAFVNGPDRSSSVFDPEADFWAETELVHGSVVRFAPGPDVAIARSRTPATVTLERTGAGPLTVKLRLEDPTGLSAHSQPGTPYSAERFGPLASLGADVLLTTADGSELRQAADGTFPVSFDPAASLASIHVVPVNDQAPEPAVLYFSIDESGGAYVAVAARPGVNSHPYLPNSAAVAICSGPRFQLMPLSDGDPYPNRPATATFANAIDNQSPPRLVGGSTFDDPNTQRLGSWNDPAAHPVLNRLPGSYPASAQLRGLSFNSLAVGTDGTNALVVDLLSEMVRLLPGLTSEGPADAFGISPLSPNAPPGLALPSTWITGSALGTNGVWRPVLWSPNGGGWIARDLGALREGDNQAFGTAYAVNDSGRAAGVSELPGDPPRAVGVRRAFRAAPARSIEQSPAPDGLLDVGRPKTAEGTTVVPKVNVARAINMVGDVVGGSDLAIKNPFGLGYRLQSHAVLWRQDRSDPTDLGALTLAEQSEALGVNASLARSADGAFRRLANGAYYPEYVEAVGWSFANWHSTQRRAFYALHTPYFRFWTLMLDLNDAHVVAGLDGWILEEARAINDQGCIVGVGSYRGANRGFMLAPLSSPAQPGGAKSGRTRPYYIDPVHETPFDFIATVAGVNAAADRVPPFAEEVRFAGVALGEWEELGPAQFTNSFRLIASPGAQVLVSLGSPEKAVFLVSAGTVIRELVSTQAVWAAADNGFPLLVAAKLRECGSTSCVETVLWRSGPLAASPEAILAVRMLDQDGWHYGWISVSDLSAAFPVLGTSRFGPDPDLPVTAGEPVLPRLHIEHSGVNIRLSWSDQDPKFALESTAQLPAGGWTPVPGATAEGGRKVIVLPSAAVTRYFRLRR